MQRSGNVQLPLVIGCVIRGDTVLLAKRNEPNMPMLHGMWELPGGKIAFGEDPRQTCERELVEETGVRARARDLLPFPYAAVRHLNDGNDIHVISLCFLCEFVSHRPPRELPEKVAEYRWWRIRDLNPTQIQSGSFRFLRHAIQGSSVAISGRSRRYTDYVRLEDPRTRHTSSCEIMVESSLLDRPAFCVRIRTSGIPEVRLPATQQKFDDRDEVLAYLMATVSKATENHLSAVEQSEMFPFLPNLAPIVRVNPKRCERRPRRYGSL